MRSFLKATESRGLSIISNYHLSKTKPSAGHSKEGEELADYMPKSQPALLTVTADGLLRVWVEVTMESTSGSNPLATEPPSTAMPGLPGGSHFCVTLVIQPPTGFWGAPMPETLRAGWCVPDGGVFALTGPQIRAAKVLWIVAIAKGPGRLSAPSNFFSQDST